MKKISFRAIAGALIVLALMQSACKKEDPPTIKTLPVTEISSNTSKSGGSITDDGGNEIHSKGIVWSTHSDPTVENYLGITMEGLGLGVFTSVMTSLIPATQYYVKAYATNSMGVFYGDQQIFTTEAPPVTLPIVVTLPVTGLTHSSASGGGTVTSHGATPVNARGVCWGTAPNPDINGNQTIDSSGLGSFTSKLTGLSFNTIYYVRAYATNSTGTAYGNQVIFGPLMGDPCPGPPTFTDVSGNVYHTVQIGNQCWMKENLKTGNYSDGTSIPTVTGNSIWTGLTSGARCWYNNDSAAYATTYGALYNWYAVDNTKGLCPTGWHVPTEAEWNTLADFLDGWYIAGGPLKETGIAHWVNPNTAATNSSGFTALPGGYRSLLGTFNFTGHRGYWWSASSAPNAKAWYRYLFYNYAYLDWFSDQKGAGLSVRCVRDN